MQRNQFLKLAGLSAGAVITSNAFGKNIFDQLDELNKRKIKNFGLQLWSVRDFMAKDAKATLKSLSEYGYKQVESFEGEKGMFWGMTAKDFKSYITDLGMTMKTSHCNTNENFDKKVADAISIGMEYLIYPWEGADKTLDNYKKMAADFNVKGEICRKNGLGFAFHNHDFSFTKLNGEFPQDILMNETDKDLVKFQMDIYWVVTAGQDPIEWLNKNPNRYISSHVKDRQKNATTKDASCVLGTGSIDYAKIIKVAKRNGMKFFNIEQERYDEGTSLRCVELCAQNMKKLKY